MPKSAKIPLLLAAAAMMTGAVGSPAWSASIEPQVKVQAGQVLGSDRDAQGVLVFKGIPYAAPAVGALRWHAPQAAPAWQGVRNAKQFGPRCLSALTGDPAPGPPHSEDCLSLNIWTAAAQTSEKRPVMVWIHGGGFQFGSSADPTSDGSRLAQKGVVVVTINHRLGVMGFMAHPDLDKEGPSGDYGLQDQIAALRWVKANIASFGGDPNNVTLFGESAGSHAVGLLMASPLAAGLFHKAIGESGAFWDSEHGSLSTGKEARDRGVALAKSFGAKSLAELRAVPAEQLNKAAGWDFTQDPGVTAFSPSVDGYVLPQAPAARFAAGKQSKIPLLAGWNTVEQFPFRARMLPQGTAAQFQDAAVKMFGKARLAEFLKLYPAGSDEQAKASADALVGDLVISQQTWEWLDLHHRTSKAPVYGYKFTYTSPYVPVASHAVEPPFVFGTLTPQRILGQTAPPADADRALSETVMAYWVNFARAGNPNGPGLPVWPAYDGARIQELGQKVGPVANPQLARFRFLATYRAHGVFPAAWRNVPVVAPPAGPR